MQFGFELTASDREECGQKLMHVKAPHAACDFVLDALLLLKVDAPVYVTCQGVLNDGANKVSELHITVRPLPT